MTPSSSAGVNLVLSEAHLKLVRQRLVVVLIWAEAVLAGLHMMITWAPAGAFAGDLVKLVHLDREGNLPSWFSAIQLALLGITMLAIFMLVQVRSPGRHQNWLWMLGAVAAFFMSADEAAAIHELLGTMLADMLRSADRSGVVAVLRSYPSYYWALIYVPVALPLGVFGAFFLWRELGRAKWKVLLGMATFGMGAVVIDCIEGGWGNKEHGLLSSGIVPVDLFLIEEMMEMVGVTLIVIGMAEHASSLVLGQAHANRSTDEPA